MRLIVTDHHEVGAHRPSVDALINPKQPDCAYPFDGLAACGVAYKLLVALEQRAFPGRLDPGASLDAVALGTVADVVPLRAENRAIVRAGLRRLSEAPSPGCAALLAVAGLRGPVAAEHRGLSPGRMSCAVRANAASIWRARHGRRADGIEESIRRTEGLSRPIRAGSFERRRVLAPDHH